MDPSSAQHHQEMGSQTLESMLVCTKSQLQDKKPKPQPEQSLKCPRCDSTNTKFCYYNNYSLSQPRYFCKSCRRYWTKGGTLRNVPVGGGCRKNKRSSSSSKIRSQDQGLSANPSPQLSPLPGLTYDSSDLSLAFARLQKQSTGQLGFDGHDLSMMGNHNTTHCDVLGQGSNGFFDALRGGFIDSQNGFHTLYYGNNTGHGENGVGINCNNEEMGIMGYHDQDHHSMRDATTTAVTVTSVKQEYCNGREGESRVLWGFPWQIGGDQGNIADFENSGRESWNGIGASWHGLLNSPLM